MAVCKKPFRISLLPLLHPEPATGMEHTERPDLFLNSLQIHGIHQFCNLLHILIPSS